MIPIKIYSMTVCPYAQRTRMLLEMKNIPFELTELDISKPRPSWFLEMNPSGQVPVIEHDGQVLNESSIINEYLEECFPEPPTLPADRYRRALTRILINYGNNTFIPLLYRMLMNQDRQKHASIMESVLASWRWIDDFLVRHSSSNIFLWGEFGMADLSFAPFFQRYKLNEYYRGFELPASKEYARVRLWRDALVAHPLALSCGLPDDDCIKVYEDYSLGYSNGKVPPGRERSSFDLSVPLAGRPLPPRPAEAELLFNS